MSNINKRLSTFTNKVNNCNGVYINFWMMIVNFVSKYILIKKSHKIFYSILVGGTSCPQNESKSTLLRFKEYQFALRIKVIFQVQHGIIWRFTIGCVKVYYIDTGWDLSRYYYQQINEDFEHYYISNTLFHTLIILNVFY